MTQQEHPTDVEMSQVSEEQLINRAQEAVNNCRWVVGECAVGWTKRYARGRTDADFGLLIGLTGDQVYQRRRVFEAFGTLRQEFAFVKWSHFYAALTWEDARNCLQWAEEMQSTVAEMKAWRRAQRGEDLTADAAPDEESDPNISYLPTEPSWVQDPAEFAGRGARGEPREPGSGGESDERLAGVARQFDQEEYSPYRQGAGSPAPKASGGEAAVAEPAEGPSTEQLARRMASTLERCVKVMTPEFAREFRRLPEPVRNKLIKAVGELSARMADLM